MGGGSSESSSSGEEDGDAEWKAAINSVAASSSFMNGFSATSNNSTTRTSNEDDDDNAAGDHKLKPQQLKHYQVKAQKLLDDILEKTLVIVRDPINVSDNYPKIDDGGVRLFKHAPPGIVFDHVDELQQPKKRPKILPGKEIDEKSKKFRRCLQSIVVDGEDIMAAARDSHQKSLARLEAKDAAAKREEERVAELRRIRGERWLPSIAKEKAAAKREEERVAELKRIRGERSLPSIAKEMQVKFQR